MTPGRVDLLQKCANAGAKGFCPQGREWASIYWLAARGMLQSVDQGPAKPPKFIVTGFGLTALADHHNNRETA